MKHQLARLAAFAETLGHLYLDAAFKMEVLLEFVRSSDAPDESGASAASTLLAETLRRDLIRDLWALCLDPDDRAPTIAHLVRELDEPMTRGALRVRFVDTEIEAWQNCGAGQPCVDYSSASQEDFNETAWRTKQAAQTLLNSDLANRLRLARNQAVAHYGMIKGANRSYALFDLSSLRLGDRELQLFLDGAEPIVLNLARLLAARRFDLQVIKRSNRDLPLLYGSARATAIGWRSLALISATLPVARSEAENQTNGTRTQDHNF